MMTRREAVRVIAGGGVSLICARSGFAAEEKMILRQIPASGETLPVIGLGTSQTFDVGAAAAERAPLEEVLSAFVRLGGSLVDTSPMYGRAEAVIGEIVAKQKLRDSLFLATKVWTTGREKGIAQMERSLELLGAKKLDLIQVHNLVDLETQLATLRAWKVEGRVRYLGITHYTEGSQPEVARVLEREKVDFVQINYSMMERAAEKSVLPVAKERGVAVLVNRPFGRASLFERVRGRALPDWAREFDCTSWAQFFLKWIIAHEAVTCVIPATSKVEHLRDNMQAGHGRLPDAAMRERMLQAMGA